MCDCVSCSQQLKRMGGGFGGKETRTVFVAASCAVAAKKLGRPVRMTLDRDEDMSITGTCLCVYFVDIYLCVEIHHSHF